MSKVQFRDCSVPVTKQAGATALSQIEMYAAARGPYNNEKVLKYTWGILTAFITFNKLSRPPFQRGPRS